ncbi:MAG: Rrf2 family transcriptional regulator [Candidatus Aminicenantes bacterium]|nr:Rrf2 family transcriptional regulator [Candidatus Aminicenantes bacterium]
MKINTKIRYSLRMLVILAEKNNVMNTTELGEKMLVSPKYLRKLAGPLEKRGLIKSMQGVYGGYFLDKKPEAINLVNIFEAFGEKIDITGCTGDENCPLNKDCLTRPLWEHLQKIVRDELHKITIKRLAQQDFTS